MVTSANNKTFKAKVLGKWIKGVFWKRPMVSLQFDSLVYDTADSCADFPVKNMAHWHGLTVGDKIDVEMSLAIDGLWYPVYS